MSIHPAMCQRTALVREASAIPFPAAEFAAAVPGACGGCRTWAELVAWADGVNLQSAEADFVLRWLLRGIRDQPQRYQVVLMLVAWPALNRLSWLLRRLESDHWALWTHITSAFLQVALGLDLDARNQLIGRKLLNDTQRNVRRQYARERRRQESMRPLPDDASPDEEGGACLEPSAPDPAFERFELRHDGAWSRSHLKQLVRRGDLTRTDYLLLIGRHLYGRTAGDLAARVGLSPEAARKRQQRAAKILQEIANRMSQDGLEHGLDKVEALTARRRRHG